LLLEDQREAAGRAHESAVTSREHERSDVTVVEHHVKVAARCMAPAVIEHVRAAVDTLEGQPFLNEREEEPSRANSEFERTTIGMTDHVSVDGVVGKSAARCQPGVVGEGNDTLVRRVDRQPVDEPRGNTHGHILLKRGEVDRKWP
jgi:hypothetical protein